jgi:hypothetical protein
MESTSKRERGGKNPTGIGPWNRMACHSISTALLQSVAKIGTPKSPSRKQWNPQAKK